MTPRKQFDKPDSEIHKKWSAWRLLSTWAIALAVAAVILIFFRDQSVCTDEPPVSERGFLQAHSNEVNTEVDYCITDDFGPFANPEPTVNSHFNQNTADEKGPL